jgi:structural maintenance of chromosome 1
VIRLEREKRQVREKGVGMAGINDGVGGGPKREEEAAHLGRIVQLTVENFKSYRGTQVIGPFHSFTAVIGPNGSGKSNLMDAVSFVLGVRTAQLRGNLRDLLYNNTDLGPRFERPRRGCVKLLFQSEGEGALVEFSRHIVPSGTESFSSQYRIDGENVGWDAYNERLKSFGILVKARNFLVFQVGHMSMVEIWVGN